MYCFMTSRGHRHCGGISILVQDQATIVSLRNFGYSASCH